MKSEMFSKQQEKIFLKIHYPGRRKQLVSVQRYMETNLSDKNSKQVGKRDGDY